MRALALLLFATTAHAQSAEALFPAAQCAAFWLGRDDYARQSATLAPDPTDRPRAEAYRRAAVRLNGNNADGIDTFINGLRPTMAFLFDAWIFGGDAQARDMHTRLSRICAEAAPTFPETRDLP